MPELDDLLRPDLADSAARSAQAPDFHSLAARGRRRRHVRGAAMAGVAVVLAVSGTAVLAGLGPGRTSVPDPAVPSPTVSPSRQPAPGPDAEEIVDDPHAQVFQVVASPEDQDVRAAVWRICVSRECDDRVAIAVTSDGFESRTVVPVARGAGFPWLTAAGSDAFVVSNAERHPYLLRADGSRTDIAKPEETAPVGPGEIVTRWRGYGDRDVLAVDPGTGESHWVPVPRGLTEVQADARGHLEALVGDGPRTTFAWSDDGGAGWQEHAFDAGATSLFTLVRGTPGVQAVLEGADGATLFPFLAVHRGDSAGAWERIEQGHDPQAYAGPAAVLADGRLLVDVVGWSDDRAGAGSHRPRGPYVSAGGDWSRMSPLEPDAASGLGEDERNRLSGSDLSVVGLAAGPTRVVAYVTTPGSPGPVYAVTGPGAPWTPVDLR